MIEGKETSVIVRAYSKNDLGQKIRNNAYFRYNNSLFRNNGVTPLSSLTDDEINYNLGGKGAEYIKTSDMSKIRNFSSINNQFPVVTYARSLRIPFSQICQRNWG